MRTLSSTSGGVDGVTGAAARYIKEALSCGGDTRQGGAIDHRRAVARHRGSRRRVAAGAPARAGVERGGFRAARAECRPQRDVRGAARRRLDRHPTPPHRRPPRVHAGGLRRLRALSRLLRRLSRARRLAAVRRTGLDPSGLFPDPRLARRARGGDGAVRADNGLSRAVGPVRPTRADRAADAAGVAVRVRDGRARLPAALPPRLTRPDRGRGAPPLRRGATSAGGYGGPFRGPPFTKRAPRAAP